MPNKDENERKKAHLAADTSDGAAPRLVRPFAELVLDAGGAPPVVQNPPGSMM
jgi:hypothetical protein